MNQSVSHGMSCPGFETLPNFGIKNASLVALAHLTFITIPILNWVAFHPLNSLQQITRGLNWSLLIWHILVIGEAFVRC